MYGLLHLVLCSSHIYLQAYVTAGTSPAGSVSGSMSVRAGEAGQASLEVLLANSMQGTLRSVGLHMGLQQTLLPAVSRSLHLQLAANASTSRCVHNIFRTLIENSS